MAGLLAFDNRSRGQMPVQQNYRRKPSINAKYDRILGNSQSLRTGRGSTRTLAEVGARFESRSEEKEITKKKDDMEIYRKLGVKMPKTAMGRDLNGGFGVMANLDRYRLGNIPPPKSNTPPRLDEKLRRILYPSPPPPPPPEPTPPLPELLSEHYYLNASRKATTLGQHHQPQPHQTPIRHHPQQPGQNHACSSQDQWPHMSPNDLASPHRHVANQVQGWIYTPQNGWVFIPPPLSPAHPHFHRTLPIPPPPPADPVYSMPYSDISSQHDDINSAHHDSSQFPVNNNHSDPIENQAQTFPKSILRNSSSSDSGQGHGRSVKFRNTPDFAFPDLFAQEREDTEDEVPEVGLCDPPRWTLCKPAQGKGQQQRQHQAENRLSDGEAAFASPTQPTKSHVNTRSRITVDQRTNNQDEQGHDPQSLPTNALRETSRVSTVPPLLANAHQQLLAGHGVALPVSGKRSGRALIQNLESMAEVQLDAGVHGSACTKRIHDEEDDTGEQPRSREPIHHQLQPPSSHYHEIPDMSLHRGPLADGRLSPTQPDWRDDQGHHPQQLNHRQVGRNNDAVEGVDAQPQRVTVHQSRSSPVTLHRKVSTDGRLPPLSQNWRESQRPIMAFSENESIASQSQSQSQSQTFGTQTSIRNRGLGQSVAGKNPGVMPGGPRQDIWRPIAEEVNTPPQSEEKNPNARQSLSKARPTSHEHGHYSQPHSQIPNQNQSQGKSSIKRSRETSIQFRSSSFEPVSPPQFPQRQRQRHRLNGSQPIDPDDPADITYQPQSPSSPEDQDQEDAEEDQSRSQSVSPDWENDEEDSVHGGKRMKITQGAWAKYDIPENLLPPSLPTVKPAQSRLKPRPTLTRYSRLTPLKPQYGLKDSQSQSRSQISQIENPDEEDEESWWDDIEESSSSSQGNHSDVGGKTRGNGRLSTIDEEDEETEKEVEDTPMVGHKEWVEEGFFQNGEEVGFTVWRDQY